jgi:hypothetical protein
VEYEPGLFRTRNRTADRQTAAFAWWQMKRNKTEGVNTKALSEKY